MSYCSAQAVFLLLFHCTICATPALTIRRIYLVLLCCFRGREKSYVLGSEKSAVSLLRDSRTKDKLWRSGKESDVAVLWDNCRILFIQLNCMSVLQTLELASCLLWPVQLVKFASSSFSQKTHMVGGFLLRLLSMLCLLYLCQPRVYKLHL